MKSKFVVVMFIIFSFAVESYAGCNKDEILKLLDGGYSKVEIDGICKKKKNDLKWSVPDQNICKENAGKTDENGCRATWRKAKKICSISGERLPTIGELSKLTIKCGAIEAKYNDKNWKTWATVNTNNLKYRICYENKGFVSSYYWSSSTYNNHAEFIDFGLGFQGHGNKLNKFYIYCVRKRL